MATKYQMGMAGEFLVAGEMLRRGMNCSVTYGNAKKADVIVFSSSADRFLALEVKTSSEPKWVIGNSVPNPDGKIWVFVILPPDNSQSPEFFIMLSSELNGLLAPRHEEYKKTYRAKHNKDFTGVGVESLKYDDAKPFQNQWQKILDRLP